MTLKQQVFAAVIIGSCAGIAIGLIGLPVYLSMFGSFATTWLMREVLDKRNKTTRAYVGMGKDGTWKWSVTRPHDFEHYHGVEATCASALEKVEQYL